MEQALDRVIFYLPVQKPSSKPVDSSKFCCLLIIQSGEGNALDLNINPLGELLDRNAAPSRLVGEPLGVLLVHALHRISVSEPA